jgi:hypothetical protein
VTINGVQTEVQIVDDEIWFEDYILTGITTEQLRWDSEDHATVLWQRGSFEELKGIVDHLYRVSKGNTMTAITPQQFASIEQTIHEQALQEVNHATTAKDVNELIIPPLKESDFLAIHLEQIEELAKDLHIMKDGRIKSHLKVAFTMKILDSFRDTPNIQATMRQLMMTMDYDFINIQQTLLKTYCNKPRLRSIIRERLGQLRFPSYGRAESFLAECSMVLSIIMRLKEKDWMLEYTTAINSIITKLPFTLKSRVHGKLHDLSEETRWELTIPFDDACARNEIFDTYSGQLTVADIIRNHCGKLLELDELNQGQNSEKRKDRVNRVQQSTAEDFAKSFKAAFVVFPNRGVNPSKTTDLLTEAGFEVRRHVSSQENIYFVVGTNRSKEEAEIQLAEVAKAGLRYRSFRFRETKNSQ